MTNHFFKNFLYQEALTVKLESVHKLNMQVKQKYDDLKSMCTAKDELIARLENEMKELSLFVEKTIKVFVIIFFQIGLIDINSNFPRQLHHTLYMKQAASDRQGLTYNW